MTALLRQKRARFEIKKLMLISNEMGRDRQNDGQEYGAASNDYRAVAKVLVTRAAVFDTYIRRGIYGAWAIVAPAVRRPSTRPDYQQLPIHCNLHHKL